MHLNKQSTKCGIVEHPSAHYERLVTKLIYQHCHSNSKERRVVVKKYLENGLDFPEAEEVIDAAASELEFVEANSDYVWYKQNEPMLKFIKNETSHDLGIIGGQFSHLTPPTLREKYNLPPPNY